MFHVEHPDLAHNVPSSRMYHPRRALLPPPSLVVLARAGAGAAGRGRSDASTRTDAASRQGGRRGGRLPTSLLAMSKQRSVAAVAQGMLRLAGRRVEDAGHESAGDSRSLRRRAGIGKSACVSGRRRDETRTAKEAGVSIGRWPSAGEVSPVGQGAGSSSASQPPMVAFRQRDAPTSSGAVNERLPGSTGGHVVEPGERRCVDAGHRTDVGDCEVPDAPEGPWAASSTDERACLRSRVWTLERHVERTGECGGYRGS